MLWGSKPWLRRYASSKSGCGSWSWRLWKSSMTPQSIDWNIPGPWELIPPLEPRWNPNPAGLGFKRFNKTFYRRYFMAEEKKTITSMMEEKRRFPPPGEFSAKAHIKSLEDYKKLYKRSIEDPEGFWGEQAQNLEWFKKWDKVMDYSLKDPLYIKWFQGGKTNVAANCLDRHLKNGRRNKAAIIWEGEPGDTRTSTS